jgi:outer membrane protein assembly factor BamB
MIKLIKIMIILYLTSSCMSYQFKIDTTFKPIINTLNYFNIELQIPKTLTPVVKSNIAINQKPIVAENLILFLTKNGKLISYNPDKDKEHTVTKFKSGTEISPLFYKNFMLISLGMGTENLILNNFNDSKEILKKTMAEGINSQSIIDDEFLLVPGALGSIYCFSLQNNQKLWTINTNNAIHSDLLNNEKNFYSANDSGKITNIKKSNGKIIWSTNPFKKAIYCSGLILPGQVIYADLAGNIFSLNPINGQLLWSYKTSGPVYANPASDNDFIYIGSNDGRMYKLNLKGEKIWEFNTENNITAQALVTNTQVLFGSGDGIFYIIDKNNANKLYSQKFIGRFISSPILWNNKLYVFADNDDVYLLE